MGGSLLALPVLVAFFWYCKCGAHGRQQTSLERLFRWQMGASVTLNKESPITNTLHSFLVALILIQVVGWSNFVQLSFPGSWPLFTHSPFSSPRASYLLRRGTSVKRRRTVPPTPSTDEGHSSWSCELVRSVSSGLEASLPTPLHLARTWGLAVAQTMSVHNTMHQSFTQIPGYYTAQWAPLTTQQCALKVHPAGHPCTHDTHLCLQVPGGFQILEIPTTEGSGSSFGPQDVYLDVFGVIVSVYLWIRISVLGCII